MGKLFGTDGIRGIFNREPVTRDMGFKVGRAVVNHCKGKRTRPKIVIGRDTRVSGKILEQAIVSGILSMGAESVIVGELPTPGVAFITREVDADAGIVISASHNPYEYNGFKIFSDKGYKLSDDEESEIEDLISRDITPFSHEDHTGQAQQIEDAGKRYLSFLVDTLPEKYSFKDMKIIIDCANGATYQVAPGLFHRLGAEVETLFINPDGKNINQDCGSQYTQALSRRVPGMGADIGLAFDGDGDRMIAVDERGNALTGDQILIICARMLKDRGELKNNLVVSTVMSNMGFSMALKKLGIGYISSNVGDRYVMEEMRAGKAILGGEDSGHIIFLQHHTTGDGLLSALQLLSAMKTSGQPLSDLSTLMTFFPQSLINVAVKAMPEISSIPEIGKIINRIEQGLGEKGRVLVRYSGTEPVCRIMIEGERQEEIDEYARRIADVVKRELNKTAK